MKTRYKAIIFDFLGTLAVSGEVDSTIIDLLKELKKNYKIAVCTSSAPTFVYSVLTKNNLDKLFDVIVIDSEVGLVKPEPAIFQFVLNKLGVEPSEAIFIDNNSENLEPPKEMGIKTILFKSSELLVEELKQYV